MWKSIPGDESVDKYSIQKAEKNLSSLIHRIPSPAKIDYRHTLWLAKIRLQHMPHVLQSTLCSEKT